jgi:hypothetical protein
MKIPTWITLKKLSAKNLSVGGKIMVRLGTMLSFDKTTIQVVEQWFCVALEARDGWRHWWWWKMKPR